MNETEKAQKVLDALENYLHHANAINNDITKNIEDTKPQSPTLQAFKTLPSKPYLVSFPQKPIQKNNPFPEFAKGMPITLINGSNLLHLLETEMNKSAYINIAEAKKILKERKETNE